MDGGDIDEEEKSSLRRFFEQPCLRRSHLYGMSSGIGIGLAHFMFTSNPPRSTLYGLLGYSGVTMAIWLPCRYNYYKQKREVRINELRKRHRIMFEGTDIGREYGYPENSGDGS